MIHLLLNENGLVDLNRDVLMKLIRLIRDEKKIKNLIGMTGLFYSWSKMKIFIWATKLLYKEHTVAFEPKESLPSVNYFYSPTMVSFNGNDFNTVALRQDLSRPRIYLLDATVSGSVMIGVAVKSAFPALYSNSIDSIKGMCVLFSGGILIGESFRKSRYPVAANQFWDNTKALVTPVSVSLELNQESHTLHFFVHGKQITDCVTHVPTDVCFVISPGNSVDINGATVRSLRSLNATTTDTKLRCKQYRWNE